jgi:hypothetical protein
MKPEYSASEYRDDRHDSGALEAGLRGFQPIANQATTEDLLFRIGYEAAERTMRSRSSAWISFSAGAFTSGIAASLLWVLAAKTPDSIPRTLPNSTGVQFAQQEAETEDQELLAPAPAESRTDVTTASASPPTPQRLAPTRFVSSRMESEELRNSLNPLVKQQWDRRRLQEKGRAILDPMPDAFAMGEVPASVWELRHGMNSLTSDVLRDVR